MDATLSVLGLGLVLGLKHALDADHIVAVSTLVGEKRGIFGAPLLGALWGLGHTASLLAVGAVVLITGAHVPDRLALALEFGVAVMLVLLGANVLRTLAQGGRLHVHGHVHGARQHLHPHVHQPGDIPPHRLPFVRFELGRVVLNRRPFFIGLVHGMAGSAALMLLVLGTISSRPLGFAYIGIFGLGSIGGMLAMSTVMSLPFLLASRWRLGIMPIKAMAGAASLVIGGLLIYEIGIVEGLLV